MICPLTNPEGLAMNTPTLSMKMATAVLALAGILPAGHAEADSAAGAAWVTSWQASPQPVWGADFLFPSNVPTILSNQTVRLVARLSLGGKRLRVVLSNAYGRQPLALGKVTAAHPIQGSVKGEIASDSLRTVTFAGRSSATIAPGASLVSDPVDLPTANLKQVTISIHVPQATPLTTFHWDGRQTGWITAGEQSAMGVLRGLPGNDPGSTTARPILTGLLVETEQAPRAVAIIGDSITDGATASLDRDRRWPDFLAARLAPHGVAVSNAGISGGRLLSDGMGVNALARLDRDVLSLPGVRSVVVLIGINDIAWPGTAFAPDAPRPGFDDLVAGYLQLIGQAHRRGVRVIGGTLTPFEGALPDTPLADYYGKEKDALRKRVNAWIRQGGAFDAVIDFDAVLRDAAHPDRIAARFDSGDHLHPGDEGNRAMAQAVDLQALLPGLAVTPGLPAPR
ncbi:GDSL-like Lipase/Acylhydrolase [Bordetella ansorpii]|uniref:GDSL-like Lipase/Acylhydrolase n=2 Tax=Bordetella ansorpii TaxID=288768 RepID=A0A157L9X4_9BORD|nr:GDSL-like Lipase/Acylhydrolase [Bordetella ansorpii]